MTPTQCVKLLALIAARCPAQRLEETTADAWYPDLERFAFEDAAEAVRRVSATKPFVALADVLGECVNIRNDRVARALPAPVSEPSPMPADFRSAFRMPTARVDAPDRLEREVAMAAPCAFCGARPGRPCEVPGVGKVRSTPHPLRGRPDQESNPTGRAS